MQRIHVGSLAFLLVFGVAATVHAQPRVAVAPLTGHGAAALRRVVVEAVRSDARVAWTADAHEADALLSGGVRGRRTQRRLTLTLASAEGAPLGNRTVAPRGPAIRAAVAALLALVPSEQREAVASAPSARASSPEVSAVVPEPPAAARDASFGDDPALFSFSASVLARSRQATFVDAAGAERGAAINPYLELAVRLEARPFAHEPSYARGLYAFGEGATAPGLSSRAANGATVATTFYRLALGAGYLVPIGPAVELGAGFGVGYDAFELGDNDAVPTAAYPYVRPALRARWRALGEIVVFGLEGGYRALLGRGDLSTAFGAGGASFGWDATLTIGGTVDVGLSYGVEIGVTQYVHSFESAGQASTHGTDGGYRLGANLGYAIR